MRVGGSRALIAARLAVGPMALLGFFLPWIEGPGVLAGQTFSGYELLDTVTVLQAAGIDRSTTLWAGLGRATLVAFAVLAVSHATLVLLAAGGRAQSVTGWMLVVITALALAVAILQTGTPQIGLWMAVAAASIFVASRGRRML